MENIRVKRARADAMSGLCCSDDLSYCGTIWLEEEQLKNCILTKIQENNNHYKQEWYQDQGSTYPWRWQMNKLLNDTISNVIVCWEDNKLRPGLLNTYVTRQTGTLWPCIWTKTHYARAVTRKHLPPPSAQNLYVNEIQNFLSVMLKSK
jgi:hypothetical protein